MKVICNLSLCKLNTPARGTSQMWNFNLNLKEVCYNSVTHQNGDIEHCLDSLTSKC